MRKITFFMLFIILSTVKLTAQSGFTSVTNLSPLPISLSTKDNQQAKVWTYAGKWWCVLSTSDGTKIFRLDGTTWTAVFDLASTTGAKGDCLVVGNLVHIILYRGGSNNNYFYTLEYDAANNTYKFWTQRPTPANLEFSSTSETAALAVDGTGRMWIASGGENNVYVWWSDAPYTTFSAPITIAAGIAEGDSYTITALPGKVGIFWSNQNTQRFGFKTHNDGDAPTAWSADEVPASQSAIDNIGDGMATDQMNIKVGSDGTLYCVAKTNYMKIGYPKLILLVRHSNGSWDNAYPVTINPEGTRPVVILNEAQNKLKVVYTSEEAGGDIVYRESATSNISFGTATPLINGNGNLYNYSTSTHQNYNSEVLLLATNLSANPLQAVGVLASDGGGGTTDQTPPTVVSSNRQSPTTQTTSATSVTFRVTFSESVSGVDVSDFSLTKTNTVSGTISSISGSGTTYDVAVSSISGSGDIRIDINASGTGIVDAAGNALNDGFTAGQVYTIGQTANNTFPFGATWKYLDNGSNQGTAWSSTSYDDASWKSGPAELGYGDGDEATVVSYGNRKNNKYITTYFRKNISINDPSFYSSFTAKIKRDDGAVVYVNGTEVYRTNMPDGTINYTTLAMSAADDGNSAITFPINASAFVAGNNVIAVEIHQTAKNSSDISFDFELIGNPGSVDQTPPAVVSINRQSPATQTTSATSVTYRVTFSEKVSGVDATDFSLTVVSGAVTGAITGVAMAGTEGTTYDVTVGSITGNGDIRLDLKASGTNIVDAAGNAINGGFTAGQTYTIQASDQTAPTVVSSNRQSPTTQTTSATSVIFRVTFSESVTGVDVTDFSLTKTNTVSGTISSISGSGSSYDVTVNSISGSGDLKLDVNASGTGITDAAGNALSGGFTSGQVYTIQQTIVNSTITRGPYLQMANGTAVTVRWRTDKATDSRVEAGTSYGNYTVTATNPDVTTEHEVRITGLKGGTKYFYRLGSITQIVQEDATNYFTTAPSNSTTQKVRIAVFGDCGNSNTTQTKVLNAYLNYTGSTPAEMMLLLGDNAYVDGTDDEYQTKFFEPYDNTVLKNHVLFPTPGNHDYHTTSTGSRDAPYYKNFTMPTAGECGGVASGTEAYYSFNWGNIHFISLDSYGTESSDATHLYDTLGPQVTWVKKDLAANTLPWVVAYWHHPPFTKGTHNSDTESDLIRIRQNFIRILERYGVDLVLCGHSHVYERSYLLKDYYGTEDSFDPNIHTVSTSSGKYNGSSNSCPYTTTNGQINHGTVYVVSGSSAHSGSTVEASFPHDALPFATTAGEMLYLEVENNRLDAKCIREDGVVFDQFTIMKDVNKTSGLSVMQGTPVTLTASWVGNYKWSNGATTKSITVTPNTDISYTVTDGVSCLKDVFNVNVTSTSALTMNEMAKRNSMSNQASLAQIFPSLVERGKNVTIRTNINEGIETTIVDYSGRLIRSFRISGTTSLETSKLAAGMYFIILKSKNKVVKQKIIVTN